nr:MAG TPA: hypothetical protein [Caudoviricetes sp.]DAT69751.1 MAG TPA: hypothetical protein [Caudoviricetes sp.]
MLWGHKGSKHFPAYNPFLLGQDVYPRQSNFT